MGSGTDYSTLSPPPLTTPLRKKILTIHSNNHAMFRLFTRKFSFMSSGWPKLWPVGRPHCFVVFFNNKIGIEKYCPFKKKKKKNCAKNEKKGLQSDLLLVTRPLNRKHNYSYGQPYMFFYYTLVSNPIPVLTVGLSVHTGAFCGAS